MAWVRIDEGFPEHPKVLDAGPLAAWLHVCAIAYCNRQLTDGYISQSALPRLSDGKRTKALAARLVGVGLWETVDSGWLIHDYLHFQPSKASVETERAKARERMANARRSSPEVRPNNPRSSDDVRLTRPDPTRPDSEQVSDNSTPADTHDSGGGPVDIRRNSVADHYARIAISNANGTITKPNAYRRTARNTALEHPDLDRYLTRWPTAPPDAIAAWLHGDKHSMSYYHDNEDTTA